MAAHLLKSSNQFTAYNFYPIELKFGRMILDISPLDRSEAEFAFSFLGARLLEIFESIHRLQYSSDRAELG